ncbi:hypothetical protein GCM10023307_01720 [Lysobacter hankyongensis]|uniref:Uncharacterized protein n=1 Tax=Lysobacter hankyongensis TaxID=1176535 RepID=A0ABP9AIB5_9GAMM
MRKNSSTSGCSAFAAKNWRMSGVCWSLGAREGDAESDTAGAFEGARRVPCSTPGKGGKD